MKLVALVINKLLTPAVVIANAILPVPKLILRVLLLLELNIPVVHVNPLKSIVPATSVVSAALAVVSALPNVQVPPRPLKLILGVSVVLLVVIV